jgi:hypothetical protein
MIGEDGCAGDRAILLKARDPTITGVRRPGVETSDGSA